MSLKMRRSKVVISLEDEIAVGVVCVALISSNCVFPWVKGRCLVSEQVKIIREDTCEIKNNY